MGKRLRTAIALILAILLISGASAGSSKVLAEDLGEYDLHTVIFTDTADGSAIYGDNISVWPGRLSYGVKCTPQGTAYRLGDGQYTYRARKNENIVFGEFTVNGANLCVDVTFAGNNVCFDVDFYDYITTQIPALNGAAESPLKTQLIFYAVFGGRTKDTQNMNLSQLISTYGRQNVNIENERTTGLVEDSLDASGNIVLKAPYTCEQDLFGNSAKLGTKKFPFSYNNGYYEYDSNNNHVEYTESSDTLIKYNVSSNTSLNDENTSIKQNDGFYPFNTIYYNGGKAPGTPAQGVVDRAKSFLFGMTMPVTFVLPEDGKAVDGNDLIYTVYGDDDIWVYLCSKDENGTEESELVLDYGGIHGGAVGGTFNFTKELADQAAGNGTLKNPLVPGREYTIKLFYLERGAYYSRFNLRFNLPPDGTVPTPTPTETPPIITPTETPPTVTPPDDPTPTPSDDPTPTPPDDPTPTPPDDPTPTPSDDPTPTPPDDPTPTPPDDPTPTPPDDPTPTPPDDPTPTPPGDPTPTPPIIIPPTATPTIIPPVTPMLTPTPSSEPTLSATPTPHEEVAVPEEDPPAGDDEEDGIEEIDEDPDIPAGDDDELPKTGTLPYDAIMGIGAGLIGTGGFILKRGKKKR